MNLLKSLGNGFNVRLIVGNGLEVDLILRSIERGRLGVALC